ncbi:MAG TPA: fibronectin type III domain-containing protein [Candidatus Limnocylindria bacterium]|nr:fibronectin type III domain-containing protein [Candidatus Limnocylindria bacterium]
MMKTPRRILALLLVPALLFALSAPARAVTSAYAGIYPASASVGSAMSCFVYSEIGSGDYRYSFELWRDGAPHAQGPQGSSSSTYAFTPTMPGIYHAVVTVIDRAYNNQITIQTGTSRVSLRPGPAVKAEAVNGTALKVSWGAVSGAVGYEVWRGTSRAGTYRLAKYVEGTSFTNTYLQSGVQYFYKVRSVHLIGGVRHVSSAFGEPACGMPMERAVITSLNPAGKGRALLAWGAVAGATGYEVSVSAAAAGPYRTLRTTSALSLTMTGLEPGAPYYYMVRAYRRIGTVNYYGAYSGYRGIRAPQ